ncbi:hypothetical protein [Cupriavidus basilensis]|uniref:hypothetical protein n=1 Tax=Cupriavidus basilensis TaxID=68895 RepID=UPI002851B5A4|nr:hypothetical protein [Cupriavidus basilensis]MDR3380302.1 hypothetical protein [Cupriavidus basilensis]
MRAHLVPNPMGAANLWLKGGFAPGCLYEITCVAKDPKVMGVGLAALRDAITFYQVRAHCGGRC